MRITMKKRNSIPVLILVLLASCTGSRPSEGEYRIEFTAESGAYSRKFPLEVSTVNADSLEVYWKNTRSVLYKNKNKVDGALSITDPDLGQVQSQTPFLLRGTIKGNDVQGDFETTIITHTNPTVYYDTLRGQFHMYPL